MPAVARSRAFCSVRTVRRHSVPGLASEPVVDDSTRCPARTPGPTTRRRPPAPQPPARRRRPGGTGHGRTGRAASSAPRSRRGAAGCDPAGPSPPVDHLCRRSLAGGRRQPARREIIKSKGWRRAPRRRLRDAVRSGRRLPFGDTVERHAGRCRRGAERSSSRVHRVRLADGAAGRPLSRRAGQPAGARLVRRSVRRARRSGGDDRPAGVRRLLAQPDRRLENWPADAAAAADDLGADRFAVTGFSTGGEYAVACAALLPDRPPRSAPRCAKKAMRPCRGSCVALRCTTSWIRPSRGEVACS